MGFLNTLLINIKARASGVRTGTKQAESALLGLRSTVVTRVAPALAGAFSVGAITRWAGAALNAADATDNLANQMGVTAERAQDIKFTLDQAGLGINAYQSAVERLADTQKEALEGNQDLMNQLSFLTGMGPGAFAGLSPDELITRILDERQRRDDIDADQLRASLGDVGGRQFPRLISALARTGGFQAAPQRLSNIQVATLDAAEQSVAEMKVATLNLGAKALVGLLTRPFTSSNAGLSGDVASQAFLGQKLDKVVTELQEINRDPGGL